MAKQRPIPFDPKTQPYKSTTLARQVARQNLTRLNNALWVTEHSRNLVADAFPSLVLPSAPSDHGCFGSEEQWRRASSQQLIWVRQHILLSAASLLEVYFASAISAALWANPTLIDRSLSHITEIQLIKNPGRAPRLAKLIRSQMKPMVSGKWLERFHKMSTIFGILPKKIEEATAELQTAQSLRNQVAHAFGHRGETPRRVPWEAVQEVELDIGEIEKYLTTVNQVIRAADLGLFIPLIGSYEMLYEFHAWLTPQTDPFTRPSPDKLEEAFRKHIADKFGSGPNKKYYKALISYYEAS